MRRRGQRGFLFRGSCCSAIRVLHISRQVHCFMSGLLRASFFLARRYLGLRIAVLAAVAYGLSMPALDLASYPGPRAHPFFYVGMIYFTCRWVERKDARFLAAALFIWAAGMLVFLGLAPALFGVLAAWLIWRPPVRVRPLALTALLALIIWFPYLRFEAARGFVDIRSQVRRKDLPLQWADWKAWCDATRMPSPAATAGGMLGPISGK